MQWIIILLILLFSYFTDRSSPVPTPPPVSTFSLSVCLTEHEGKSFYRFSVESDKGFISNVAHIEPMSPIADTYLTTVFYAGVTTFSIPIKTINLSSNPSLTIQNSDKTQESHSVTITADTPKCANS